MRLIDADELTPDTEWDETEDSYISYSKTEIDCAPTVDAVGVVRCKDCIRISKCGVSDEYYCADGKKGKKNDT